MPGWLLPPHEETTTLSIRIPKSLRKRLDAIALARHRTLTHVCVFLLDAGLAELEKAQGAPPGEVPPRHARRRPPKK